MIKPAAQTLNPGQPLQDIERNPVFPSYYKEDVTEERCNLGMISSLDPRDLPPGAFSLVQNARNRYDRTDRRSGMALFTPDKSTADTNIINKLYLKKSPNGNAILYRFTPTSIYSLGSLGWTPIHGVGNTTSAKDVTVTEVNLVAGFTVVSNFIYHVTLTAARLVGAPLGGYVGQKISFVFTQDGAGGHAVTWNAIFNSPTWSDTGNTSGKVSTVSFIFDGTHWNEAGAQVLYGTAYVPPTFDPTGSVIDQWSVATIFNRLIFSQNGLGELGVIKQNGTYKLLTDSPFAKYVTGFYNRLVAACVSDGTDQGPISVYWTGEINLGLSDWEEYLAWDPLTDPSAGTTPLIDSPTDEQDFITGIQGAANVIVVLRQKSIWLGNKQPIAENPFRFYAALPGIGCDCPHSVQVGKDGIIWTDTRTRSTWHYQPGGGVEKISSNVEPLIITDLIGKQEAAFSSFNHYHNEYYLCIPQDNYTKQWIFNFDTKAWDYDEIPLCHSVLEIDNNISSALLVSELSGKVSALNPLPSGKVANFANLGVIHQTRRIYGLDTGDIIQEDDTLDTDNGASYTSEWQSKDFTFPEHTMLINYIRVDVHVYKQINSLYLYYSLDSGLSWKLARGPKVCPVGPLIVTCSIGLKAAARIRWKLDATDGLFSITSHSLKIQRGGVVDERANIHL